jgi:hypothetical protein
LSSLRLEHHIETASATCLPWFQIDDDAYDWKLMKPEIYATIMDFFNSGLPIINENAKPSADTGSLVVVLHLKSHSFLPAKKSP